jgi:hypothetical protein
MKEAAESDGINLHIISAFRSVARQSEIIEEKKRKGISYAMIFSVSAPPGYPLPTERLVPARKAAPRLVRLRRKN